jgi:hypothetical protein
MGVLKVCVICKVCINLYKDMSILGNGLYNPSFIS